MASGLRFITENPFTSAYDKRLQQRYEQDRQDLEIGEHRRQRQVSEATDEAARGAISKGGGLRDIYTGLGESLSSVPGAGGQALEYMGKAQSMDDAEQEKVLQLGLDQGPDVADAYAQQRGVAIPEPMRQALRSRQYREKLQWSLGAAQEMYGSGGENAALRAQLGQQLLGAKDDAEIQAIIANAPRPRYTAPQGPISYDDIVTDPATGLKGQYDSRGQFHPLREPGTSATSQYEQRKTDAIAYYRDQLKDPDWQRKVLEYARGTGGDMPEATEVLPLPEDASDLEIGYYYTAPDGRVGRWNGTEFEPAE